MKKLLLGLVLSVLAVPVFAKAKAKEPCTTYFVIAEIDQSTNGSPIYGLNRHQEDWYAKHGDKGKYAGLCFIQNVADAPQNVPLYFISWNERLVSQDYAYTIDQTQTTHTKGTVTDGQGNTAQITGTSTTSVPVTHSGTNTFYVAEGQLSVWTVASDGKGSFVPVSVIPNNNRTPASTFILKDALDRILDRRASK